MSVCDTIARNHKGRIEFESKLNEGSTFTLYLPLEYTEIHSEELLPEEKILCSPGRILILDDEKDILQLLSTMLKNQGHDIYATDNGIKALEEHRRKSFDIALIDLQMPKLSGFDFIEKIEALSSKTPEIIIITGRLTDKNIAEAEKFKSVVMTIKKPFNIYKINNCISDIMLRKILTKSPENIGLSVQANTTRFFSNPIFSSTRASSILSARR